MFASADRGTSSSPRPAPAVDPNRYVRHRAPEAALAVTSSVVPSGVTSLRDAVPSTGPTAVASFPPAPLTSKVERFFSPSYDTENTRLPSGDQIGVQLVPCDVRRIDPP